MVLKNMVSLNNCTILTKIPLFVRTVVVVARGMRVMRGSWKNTDVLDRRDVLSFYSRAIS